MGQKVWIVTGASRGFGAEISRAVLNAGDLLVATARNTKGLERFTGNPGVLAVELDVTDQQHCRAAVEAALQRFDHIDVLVNNAGYGLMGAVEETSAAEVERLFQTNVFGLLNMTRAVLPAMRKRRTGHIVNLSSIGGYSAGPGFGIYCSTKFAVEGISEALHAELAPLGIHVTVVEPGYFRTDFLDASSLVQTSDRIPDYNATVGKVRESAAAHNHHQPGDPARFGEAIVRLAHEADPPLRLPLGTDTLKRIAEKNAFVQAETEKWRDLAASTDFPTSP